MHSTWNALRPDTSRLEATISSYLALGVAGQSLSKRRYMLELTLADRSYIDVRTNNKSKPDKSQALKAWDLPFPFDACRLTLWIAGLPIVQEQGE